MKTDIVVVSLEEALSNFMTMEELGEINEEDFSPEYILECCVKAPGVWSATYSGDGIFEINSEAGIIKFKITKKGGWK